MQQIWGLAVPMWRLPFEVLAKIAGQAGFPDRLAFAVALFGVGYFAVRCHFKSASLGAGSLGHAWSLFGLTTTLLFPPFLTLCSSRFLVWEEVEAYGFIVTLLLMFWIVWLWHYPTRIGFICLGLVSGLISFIRPTLGVYGATSVVIASIIVWHKGFGRSLIYSVVGLFVCGILLLLWSNMLRFGSPMEFGHSLTVNSLPSMAYASRFSNPFHSEGLASASKELFGLLFLTKSIVGGDAYAQNRFPAESTTFRWRELYFGTYDLTFFAVTMAVLFWFGWKLQRVFRRKASWDIPELLTLWAILAATPLIVFYLRFPFISSRYLIDFAPAFATTFFVFMMLLRHWVANGQTAVPWRLCMSLGVVLGWWSYEITTTKVAQGPVPDGRNISAWSLKEVVNQMHKDEGHPKHKPLPFAYTNGFSVNAVGIPFNGIGWSPRTEATKACVIIFLENPEFLEIDVGSKDETPLKESDCDCIQAKVGLEFLVRKSTSAISDGMRIVFQGPKKPRYQKGIQMASLAMMSPQELSTDDSRFRLLRVGWRRESPITNSQ